MSVLEFLWPRRDARSRRSAALNRVKHPPVSAMSASPVPALSMSAAPVPGTLRARAAMVVPAEPYSVRPDALREAFTPTRPQRHAKRFAGRQAQLARIMRALRQERAHVVLHAERGRGKTSLSNMVADAARRDGFVVARFACAADSDFDAIIRGLARDLPASLLRVGVPDGRAGATEGCEGLLPVERIAPRDVLGLPAKLTGRNLVLMVDEFDRVEDAATRTRIADTIKQASDSAGTLAFILIGVADSLEHLLGHHPSIQRNVVGVHLPLLHDDEMDLLLERGAQDAGLTFPEPLRARIKGLARGIPYIAQLLALHAGSAAMERGAAEVQPADLDFAIGLALAEADPRVRSHYAHLTNSARDVPMTRALHAIAAGEQDAYGRFKAELDGQSVLVAGERVSQEAWSRLVDGEALRPCTGAEPDLFAFREVGLQPYTLLLASKSVMPVPEPAGPAKPATQKALA